MEPLLTSTQFLRRTCCESTCSAVSGQYACARCGAVTCFVHAALWTDDRRRCVHCFWPTHPLTDQCGPVSFVNPDHADRPRRVLLVVDGLYAAGAQRHCLAILDVFRAHGLECTVLAVEGGGRWAHRFMSAARRVVIAHPALPTWQSIEPLLNSSDFEFVASHLADPIQWTARQVPSGIKCFAHLHCEPSEHETISISELDSILHRFERVFVPSMETLEFYLARSGSDGITGRQKRRFQVLANGLSTDELTFVPLRRRVNLQEAAGLRVAVISRLDRDKISMPLFVETVSHLHRKETGIRVQIAGDGECKDALQDAVHRAGLADVVQFLGFVDDVGPVYGWADVIFLPSKRESMPYVLLESIAASRPLVAPATGFLRGWRAPSTVRTFALGDSLGAASAIQLAACDQATSPDIPNRLSAVGLSHGAAWSAEVVKAYGLP